MPFDPCRCAVPAAPAEVEWAVPDYQWELPPLPQSSSTAGRSSSSATTRSGGGSQAAGRRPRRRLAQAPVQPNDPYFTNGTQWYLPAVSAPEAWALVSGVDVSRTEMVGPWRGFGLAALLVRPFDGLAWGQPLGWHRLGTGCATCTARAAHPTAQQQLLHADSPSNPVTPAPPGFAVHACLSAFPGQQAV